MMKDKHISFSDKSFVLTAVIGSLLVMAVVIGTTLWASKETAAETDEAVAAVSHFYLEAMADRRAKIITNLINNNFEHMEKLLPMIAEEGIDSQDKLRAMIGKIKADRNEVMFDDVRKGENPVEEIHILNTTSDIVTPVIMHLPEYMRADVSPSSIPPGRSGVVYLTLDSKRMGDYGLKQASVYLGLKAGEKVSADKEIDVSAILIPSFGVVTDQQLLYSPKVKLSDTVLDLGSFEGKKKKKGTIVIENLGRTDLEISNLQLFTPGLTIDLSTTVIPPGESAKLKVTAEKKSLKDVRKQPRILMITNDPRNPKVMVDVNIK